MKIAVDWDGTCEHEYIQEAVLALIQAGHEVQIVTTRYKNPKSYLWYKEGRDDDMHKSMIDFAEKAVIKYHFTNMEYKGKYLLENNFDVLIDDNRKESDLLRGSKCKFEYVDDIYYLLDELNITYDKRTGENNTSRESEQGD